MAVQTLHSNINRCSRTNHKKLTQRLIHWHFQNLLRVVRCQIVVEEDLPLSFVGPSRIKKSPGYGIQIVQRLDALACCRKNCECKENAQQELRKFQPSRRLDVDFYLMKVSPLELVSSPATLSGIFWLRDACFANGNSHRGGIDLAQRQLLGKAHLLFGNIEGAPSHFGQRYV